MKQYVIESIDAEIAIWDKNGSWLNFGSDEVKGYVSPDEVAKWISIVSTANTLEDIQKTIV